MPRAMFWRGGIVAVLAAGVISLVAPPPAGAAGGGPATLYFDTTSTGIASPDGAVRYYAINSGGGTDVLAVDLAADGPSGERTLDRLQLDGHFSIPGVAFDGTTSGLSADGATLALVGPPPFRPQDDSSLMLLSTGGKGLRVKDRIELDGVYTLDSISPDGSTLYLVHYPSAVNPEKYEVLAYDVPSERLLETPILDTRTAPIVMRGNPVARATSPDGVWAYTLYDGAGKTPFVHALNTAEGEALCIDVDALGDYNNPFTLGLVISPDGRTLDVTGKHGENVAAIATGTWEVSEPGAAASTDDERGGVPWAGLGAIAAGTALIGGGVVARRRRRGGRTTLVDRGCL